MEIPRHIVLTGLSGAGKSTLGPLLGTRLGLPVLDLDALVVQRAGRSIAQVFAQDGEPAFRRLELQALQEALAGPRAVIVAGAGALVEPKALEAARRGGLLVWLEVSPEAAARRCVDGTRPLLGEAPVERLRALLAEREATYGAAWLRVHTDDLTPAQVAEQVVVGLATRRTLTVALQASGTRYAVELMTQGGFERVAEVVRSRGYRRVVVVTERRVEHLYARALLGCLADARLVAFAGGERSKTPQTILALHRAFAAAELGRRDCVIALGGGIVGDVAGFAAATWLRGVDVIQVPTTLLSQVDSSVGGKTGVNLDRVKNAVGAFHHPVHVVAPLHTLVTLPGRHIRSGMAELVKHGFIADEALVAACRRLGAARDPEALLELVTASVDVKRAIVAADEREQHLRKVLNFGHTIGHAIESASGGRVLHGEGVALGMVAAARVGRALGVTPALVVDEVVDTLRALMLPHEPADWLARGLGRWIAADKKRSDSAVEMALLERIGGVDIFPVPLESIELLAQEMPERRVA